MEDLKLSAEACENLVRELGDRVVAVALFGSRARREASERSDFDFFVVVRNFNDRDRRFRIYHCLHSVVRRDVTVIDVDEGELFREDLEINPLLLNILWDSVILYDPTGRLRELSERVRNAVKGRLERYRTKDGKYGWKPKAGELTAIEV
ncbi:MAG: nucleotidyltransferase domain-containing protein [Thermofilum sp.]|jgi:predicted nucleotidyltransferase|nr:nucleotidyltransferase domain-containing protein [Thermofilum sp.]